MLCLVTAATGSLGSRLVPRLLAEGFRVRCLVTEPARLRDLSWADRVEVVLGPDDDRNRVRDACVGVDVLYALDPPSCTAAADERRRARETALGAADAGVGRIVAHFGGPVHSNGRVRGPAEILLDAPVPAAVVRAGVVIGVGTAGFEVVRHLTERAPVIVTPSWARVPVEPVAAGDLLHGLVAASRLPQEVNRAFDLSGPDWLSCAEMIRRYAAVVGLPARRMLPVRAAVPRLSVSWITAVTPVPGEVARSFVSAFLQEPARRDRDVDAWLPAPPGGLTSYDAAVARAVAGDRSADGGAVTGAEISPRAPEGEDVTVLPTDPPWAGRDRRTDTRTRRVRSPERSVRRAVDELGREGRSPPLVGSWVSRAARGTDRRPLRVEPRTEGTLMRLGVTSGGPGRMWLELSVVPHSRGGSVYHQRAVFEPRGLAGVVWWRVTTPVRGVFLAGLVRDVVRRAAKAESSVGAHGSPARPARGS